MAEARYPNPLISIQKRKTKTRPPTYKKDFAKDEKEAER